jgi:hypothetical protein
MMLAGASTLRSRVAGAVVACAAAGMLAPALAGADADPSPRPTDPGAPAEYGGSYAVAEHDPPHCTEHFCVHWVETTEDAPDLTDGDRDGVPDSVEATANELEVAHARETGPSPGGLGWRPLGDDGDRGGDVNKTDAYLIALGPYLLGRAAAETSPTGDGSLTGYVVLDRSLSGDRLEEVTAHEYNHLLQIGYDRFNHPWLAESTATWVASWVHPANTFWHRFVVRWSVATEASLIDGIDGKLFGGALWHQWLAARYGPDIVRELWERAPGDSARHGLEVYGELVAEHGGRGLFDEFTGFAAAMPEWRLPGVGFHPQSRAFPDVERVAELRPDGSPAKLELANTSFALLDAPTGPLASVRLEGSLPAGTPGAIALVGRDGEADSGVAVTALRQLPEGGTGEVGLPSPERFERITAVIVNAGNGWPVPVSARIFAEPTPSAGSPSPAVTVPQRPTRAVADHTAPTVRLSAPRHLRVRAFRAGVRVRVRSNEAGRAAVEVRIPRELARRLHLASTRIGRARARLRPGASRRVRIDLRSRAQRRLTGIRLRFRTHPARAAVRCTVTDLAGNRRRVTRAIRIAP